MLPLLLHRESYSHCKAILMSLRVSAILPCFHGQPLNWQGSFSCPWRLKFWNKSASSGRDPNASLLIESEKSAPRIVSLSLRFITAWPCNLLTALTQQFVKWSEQYSVPMQKTPEWLEQVLGGFLPEPSSSAGNQQHCCNSSFSLPPVGCTRLQTISQSCAFSIVTPIL